MAPEKRRASARLREPAPKRHATVKTPLTEKPAPNPPAKEPSPEILQDPEELLPTKLIDGTVLPTLPKNYTSSHPDSQWMSIAESGVLAASLLKSRQRWAQGRFLEKYWSKSTYKKKKDVTETDKPQSKDPRPPMTKVGTCKLIAEPHIFDITLFVVREVAPPAAQAERPFLQYGPSSPAIQPTPQQSPYAPPPHSQNSLIAKGPQPTPSSSTPTPKPQPVSQQSASTSQAPKPQPNTTPASKPSTPSVSQPRPRAGQSNQSSTPSRPTPASQSQKPASQTATDPVIHMLAQRASTDNALKQVMKIVASGQANQAELEYFQRHIDELTAIVKARQEEERRKAAQPAQPVRMQRPVQNVKPTVSTAPFGSGKPVHHTPTQYQSPQRFGTPIAAARPSPQMFTPSLNQARPKPFVPTPLHVLIEFSINSTDRFLFPRNSILEFLPNGALLASFLVVKKPSQLLETDNSESKKPSKAKKTDEAAKSAATGDVNGTAKPAKKTAEDKRAKEVVEKEYYQPITIRFESPSDPGVFNVLSRVVAPVEDVRKYMIGVAERCERASFVQLALRLPKEKIEPQIV
jgi:hypothetical protein